MSAENHPEWLEAFVEAVTGCLAVETSEAVVAAHYSRGEDGAPEDGAPWEFDVFVRPLKVVGGKHDGELAPLRFTLDFDKVRDVLDRVDSSGWDALGLEDPPGPHVWFEGRFGGNHVLLRILPLAPDGKEPDGNLDVGGAEPE